MIKGKTYNFTLPEKIELKPARWWNKPLREPKFDVIVVVAGNMYRYRTITNAELSTLPLVSICVLKAPMGTVIRQKQSREE